MELSLGIEDEAELERVFSIWQHACRPKSTRWSGRRRPAGGVELIVGCRRDRRFGPIALAGLGGLHAELIADIAVALAPIGADEA